jgi:FlaA1/EpsC-like NDP-sugar epimerase
VLKSLIKLSYKYKLFLIIILDIFLTLFSTFIALALRLDSFFIPYLFQWFFYFLSLFVVLVNYLLGGYQSFFRHLTIYIIKKNINNLIIYGLLYFTLTLIFTNYFLKYTISPLPKSIGIIQPILLCMLILISRILISKLFNDAVDSEKYKNNIIIFGAGKIGYQILNILRSSTLFNPICFVDENSNIVGRNIDGIRVYDLRQLENILDQFQKCALTIAISNLSIKKKNFILNLLKNKKLKYINKDFIINSDYEIFSKKNIVGYIKPEDVLKRDNVYTNRDEIKKFIKKKKILITGAGGTIGSELTIQVLEYQPESIMLLDNSELNLYNIEQEVNIIKIKNNLKVNIKSILLDISKETEINNFFNKNKIDLIIHTAAYKHVPLTEANMIKTFENNVIGTLNLVNNTLDHNIKNFLLISSDKAVNPENIMGLTKRISELLIITKSNEAKILKKQSKFIAVRFGNVLGSSGSVFNLFMNQILRGGPVTITHPEINRYFMTIKEACSLVLNSLILKKNKTLFFLDMGEPINIKQLATLMINLSGEKVKDNLNSQGIEIVYTGLRPGEKMFEELYFDKNETEDTENSKIKSIKITNYKFKILNKKINLILNFIKKNQVDQILNLSREFPFNFKKTQ